MRPWVTTFLGVLLAATFAAPVRGTEPTRADALWFVQKELDIPSTWARVTDASWPKDHPDFLHPEFILIQDVHRNPGVQTQITALILHGYRRWGVTKVFMEGAFLPLDLSLFHRIPKQVLPELVRGLVHDGDLSGPEVAAVKIMEREWSNPPVSPFQLFGLEDPQLYRRNVMAYREVLVRRGQALYDIASLRQKYELLGDSDQGGAVQGLALLEKLLRLKLTPKEYEVFMMYKDAAPSTPGIDSAVEAASEYYRLARLRSQAFMKIAKLKAPASSTPRILVVGGFHTDDMATMLRREHRTFIVLSPVVSTAAGGTIYQQRMQDTIQTYTDALPSRTR